MSRRLTVAKIPSGQVIPPPYFLIKTQTAAGIAPDRQNGGAYVTETGVVRHISITERVLVMESGTEIPMEDVVSTTGEIFSPV